MQTTMQQPRQGLAGSRSAARNVAGRRVAAIPASRRRSVAVKAEKVSARCCVIALFVVLRARSPCRCCPCALHCVVASHADSGMMF